MVKKQTEFLTELENRFNVDLKKQSDNRIWINIKSSDLIEICKWIKNHSFDHLSAISCVDWLDKGNYEISYHIWSYKYNILITFKTRINRDKPQIETVSSIWGENAQIHEREIHELFGVKFNGNLDLSPLFLENWNGQAPFRKDFNWREYVRKEFYNSKDEREKIYYD